MSAFVRSPPENGGIADTGGRPKVAQELTCRWMISTRDVCLLCGIPPSKPRVGQHMRWLFNDELEPIRRTPQQASRTQGSLKVVCSPFHVRVASLWTARHKVPGHCSRLVGAFPDGQSSLNLAAARLRYIAGTAWSAKCYMNMRPLYQPQVMQTEAVA
jgi:hypothetical protein